MPGDLQFDEIGPWTEIKLEILKEYASAYSRILTARKNPSFYHIYIQGFAGAGVHLSRSTQEFVSASPLNALAVEPPFHEYHLIDIVEDKIDTLRQWVGTREDVHLHPGDCNKILLEKVFPRVQYRDYRRGLCILDPYGLHLNWTVIFTAGQMKSIDMFLNFPIADMNRNVLRRDPDKVNASQAARMNAYWGGEIWRQVAYETTGSLFGIPEKVSNERVAEAFRQRLRSVAGFERVPEPLPMRNSRGATVYYLFFASQKDVAEDIVLDIFRNGIIHLTKRKYYATLLVLWAVQAKKQQRTLGTFSLSPPSRTGFGLEQVRPGIACPCPRPRAASRSRGNRCSWECSLWAGTKA